MPKIKNKRILLTGGAGFIGSALCRKLYKDNEILIIDNYRRNALSYFRKEIKEKRKFQIVEGDILDTSLLKGVFSVYKPNIVIHLAAMAGVTDYFKRPVTTMEVNAIGTYNVLEAVKKIKLDRFVYFSTSEVYGPYAFDAREDGPTGQGELKQRRWTYSISKLAGEGLAFSYSQQYKFPLTSIRPFNIYGPGQVGEGGVQIFCRKAIKDETISITGDGNQIRAWCYIDDFIEGVLSILESPKAVGEIFNLGDAAGTVTILNLANSIIRIAKSKSKLQFVPHPVSDVEIRVPNMSKAQSILDFKPSISLEEGLKRSIEWYRSIKTEDLEKQGSA